MDAIRADGPLKLSLPTASRSESVGGEDGGASFGDMFKKVLNDTSQIESGSRDLIQSFLRGEPVELHQVMAASEEASISLELLVEMRNKLTDAYRSVMNVQ
jgi:flagellar hook-basal body complex protein FliE